MLTTKPADASLSQRNFWAFLAIISVPLSGLSIDIYVPSLPAVARDFNALPSLVQLTISIYMLGFGITQFFGGSLVDVIGRKKPFIISLFIYILVTLLIPFSPNIYYLLLFRFIQGATVACLSVPMRAVLSDLYRGKDFYKMMNYMTLCWAIGPIIAPAIGGYLQEYFNWHAPFYFLAIYAIIVWFLNLFLLPETIAEKKIFSLKQMWFDAKTIMSHLDYIGGIICLGILWSIVILFSIVAPFLIQNVLHYSAIEFGHMALLMGLAWFLGNITSRFLINVNFKTKAQFCLWTMLVNGIIMSILAFFQPINLIGLLIQTFILIYLGGIVFPNYFARNVSWFPKNAATANALTGGFMTVISAASSGIGSLLKSNSQFPLTIAYLILIVISIAVYYLTSHKSS